MSFQCHWYQIKQQNAKRNISFVLLRFFREETGNEQSYASKKLEGQSPKALEDPKKVNKDESYLLIFGIWLIIFCTVCAKKYYLYKESNANLNPNNSVKNIKYKRYQILGFEGSKWKLPARDPGPMPLLLSSYLKLLPLPRQIVKTQKLK